MRIAAILIGVLLVAGCVTPSIPIPPPDPAKMTFEFEGMGAEMGARFSYLPDVNYVDAIVFVYNRDRGVGIIENANPDGSVGPTARVSAGIGDQVVVTFERDDQTVSTCIRLREGAQSSTDYCGP
jgi:hypothetical protein